MQKLFYSEEEEVDLNMLTPTIMTHSSFPKTNRSGKFIGGGRDERISIYVMMKAYNQPFFEWLTSLGLLV